jgi:transcription elongation GreA/GreB family factor
VTPQLGVAGFYIDIAVHNPDRPGEFLAAIECDGATYHSGFSVRDRDRIRQEILESLGWKGRIWRIWSTDWFFNRAFEIKKLLNFLEQRRFQSQTEESFDYEETTEELLPEKSLGPEEGVPDASWFPEARDRFVEVGDQVTYCFVNNPKEKYVVHIVEGISNPGMGILNEKTALAQALLDLSVGEENELEIPGDQNRTIRILKIQRI